MPKQYHVINDFSGGMNTRKDPRDLRDNELSHIQNMSINNLGKIRTMGFFYDHKEDQDGTTDLSEFIPLVSAGLTGGGGYGLFYFESDYGSKEVTGTTTDTGSSVFGYIYDAPDNEIRQSRTYKNMMTMENSPEGGNPLLDSAAFGAGQRDTGSQQDAGIKPFGAGSQYKYPGIHTNLP